MFEKGQEYDINDSLFKAFIVDMENVAVEIEEESEIKDDAYSEMMKEETKMEKPSYENKMASPPSEDKAEEIENEEEEEEVVAKEKPVRKRGTRFRRT
jgi:hypothetical protein